jgi:hypothetical protein
MLHNRTIRPPMLVQHRLELVSDQTRHCPREPSTLSYHWLKFVLHQERSWQCLATQRRLTQNLQGNNLENSTSTPHKHELYINLRGPKLSGPNPADSKVDDRPEGVRSGRNIPVTYLRSLFISSRWQGTLVDDTTGSRRKRGAQRFDLRGKHHE